MDAAEAFSRMGVAEPAVDSPPMKQWAIAGVNKFFPTREVYSFSTSASSLMSFVLSFRLDALDHIFDNGRSQSYLMSSRNIRKLRAFTKGEDYVPLPGEIQYDDN